MIIAATYVENESGASLQRPELFRLLADSRPEDTKRNAAILAMLRDGRSWNSIIDATGCSRSTLARLSKRLTESDEA
ncbi:hypothetical protein C6Y62_13090 [Hyphomicrobium sulfonivorans]|nr:hypothetical protein [Hyphomicrobium sulfonivorans]